MKLAFLAFLAMATAASGADGLMTEEQFGRFAQDYYLDPRPELVEAAMRFAGSSELAKRPKTMRLVQMSFSCIFARHPEHREQWKKFIATLDEPAREYLGASMNHTPQQLLDAVAVSPEKNDLNWSCFFVSGDPSYARNVVDAMQYLSERKDLQKYLTASSAQWSLTSIRQGHDRVREVLEAAAKGSDATIAAGAREALTRQSSEIQAATVETLRQQHEAGVWK
jgi:hypothetical protein